MDRSVPACIKIPPEARFEGRYVFCNNSKPPEYFSSDDSSFEDPITSSYPESNEKNQKVGSRHKIQNKLKCSRCRCWKLEKEFINVHDSRIMRTCNSCRRRNKPHASLSKMKKEQEEMLRQLPTVGLRAVSHLRTRLLWTNCHRLPLVLCHARRVMEGWKAIPLFLVPADRSCRGRLPFPFQGPWATIWTLDRWAFIP